MGGSPLEGGLFPNVRTLLIGEPQVESSRNIRDKPTKQRWRSVNAILLGQCDPSRWVRLRAMGAR